jgi:hypothetical protein
LLRQHFFSLHYQILQLYPNPSNGYFYILYDGNVDKNNLIIRDTKGQPIEFDFDPEAQRITLTNPVAFGVYFVFLITDEQQYCSRFIIIN